MGFLDYYFNQSSIGLQAILKRSDSQFAVPSALDAFCENLNWQIEYGCKLLVDKKNTAGGDEGLMLDYWNGDLTGKYRAEVLKRYNKLKKV